MSRLFFLLRVFALLYLLSPALFATTENSEDLGAVEVVGTAKSVQRLGDTPVKTEIISSDQFLKVHATDLSEALRYVPGLQLEEIHGKSGTAIWMQGYNGDRVLVLIDGSPVSPASGSTVDITQIAVGDIERIEITRGAVSALYGTSAMGGVVNIITREPVDSFRTHVDVSAGSWGSQDIGSGLTAKKTGRLDISGLTDSGFWQIVADGRFSDGFKATDWNASTQGWEGHKANLSGKFKHEFSDKTSLTLMPRIYDEDATTIIDNFVAGTGSVLSEKSDDTVRQHIAAILNHEQGSNASWKLRLMGEDFENVALQDIISTPDLVEKNRTSRLTLAGAEIRHERVLNQSHALTAGVEWAYGEMDVELITNEEAPVAEVDHKTSESIEYFLQDSWLISDGLELMPGVRMHTNKEFGNYVSPMLSLMYSNYDWLPGELTLRAGIGNGYRVPTLKELYYIFDHSHLGYMVIGNADLEPESSYSYQAGLEWLGPGNTLVELNVYRNDTRDLIETALDEAESAETGLSVYNYQNFEKTRTVGLEGLIRQSWGDYLTTSLAYTYMDAKDLSTDLQLVKRPANEYKLGLDIQLNEKSSLLFRINRESKQYVNADNTIISPGFTTADIKFNHDAGNNWEIYGGINNLTGVQRDFNGEDFRPIEGRYVYAGLRYTATTP